MNKLIKKIITPVLMSLMIVTSVVTIGCSNNKSNKESVVKFNEEEAKTESKAQLEKMLALHEDSEVICKQSEISKVKELIDNELKDYMTDDYYNDLQNKLHTKVLIDDDMLFFISYAGNNKVRWNKAYEIYTPKVDKENEALIYKIEGMTWSNSHMTIYLEMKKDDGAWKVNRLSTAEKYNS